MKKSHKKLFLWGALIIILVIVGMSLSLPKKQPSYTTVAVMKGDIVQKVSVTGKTKPVHQVDLTFDQNGTIDQVNVSIGDHVKVGDVLVTLTNRELQAQLLQAQADADAARAQLAEVKKGTRFEEIQVQEQSVMNAEQSIRDAQATLYDTLKSSFTKADYAIRNQSDALFDTSHGIGEMPRFKVMNQYSDLTNQITNERFRLEILLQNWKIQNDRLRKNDDLESEATQTESYFYQIQSYLDDVSAIINNVLPQTDLSEATLDGYKLNLSTARTTIDTAISTLSTAHEKWNSSQATLQSAQKTLDLKSSGSVPEEIDLYTAKVKSSQARVAQIQAQIDKTIMRAPMDGVIVSQEARSGEVLALSSLKEILVSMMAEGYEIELNVSETDIAKIKIGNPVELRFDAFPDQMFQSTVTFVEPGETVVQGVVYYKVKIDLDPKKIPLEIRSGMSVDTDIITDKRENVLFVPQRAILRKDDKKFVRILHTSDKTQTVEERAIETGMEDSEGHVEIISGVKEVENVITSSPEEIVTQ